MYKIELCSFLLVNKNSCSYSLCVRENMEALISIDFEASCYTKGERLGKKK